MRRKLIVSTMAVVALSGLAVANERDRVERDARTALQPKLELSTKTHTVAAQQRQQAYEQAQLKARLEAAAGRTLSDVELQKLVAHSKGNESRMLEMLGVSQLKTDRQALGGGPANNECETASAIAIGGSDSGSTVGASPASAPVCGTTDGSGGAVWYTVVGDGTRLAADLCGSAFDTKVRVYCGGCPKLFCVAGNDDNGGVCGQCCQSYVEWDSEMDRTYYILVHGFGSNEGDYTLNVSSVGKVSGQDPPICKAEPEPPALTINEIRIDQNSTDNDEYFELCGAEGTDLTDVWYLVIGDGAGGSGVIENATQLSGAMPAGGYFLAAESTFTIGPAPDLVTSLNFENSDNVTHLLVWQFSGMDGDDLDPDDDCVLDVEPWTAVIDLVALIETPGSGECTYGPPNVGPDGTFVPGHVARCADCEGPWAIMNFDTNLEAPAGTGVDTPRADNTPECPVGSCCAADGSCSDVFEEAACSNDGDIFNPGTTCSKTSCPQPPPANDVCEGRIDVTDGVTAFDSTWATTQSPDYAAVACDVSNGGDDLIHNNLWFNYQATCSGIVTVSVCEELGGSASFDSRIAIHDGIACPADPATAIGCNDDDPNNACGGFAGGFHSTATAPVVAGNSYKINLGGFSDGEAGPGDLLIACEGEVIGACCAADGTCQELSSEDCAAAGGTYAGDATLCSTTPCNDACVNRLDITDGLTPFTTLGSTTDGSTDDCVSGSNGDFDGNAFNDVWFNYTATCNGLLNVNTCEELGGSADFDTRIQIYDGCGCPADSAPIVCNDDDPDNACGSGGGGFHSTAEVGVSSGNCYKIRVGGFGAGDFGSGVLDVSCELAGGACCDGITCTDVSGLEECIGLGGVFQGLGSACDTAVCGGACCDGDDNCTQQPDEDTCLAGGGIAFTSGSTCDDVACFQCPISECDNLTQSGSDANNGAVRCASDFGTTDQGYARCFDLSAEIGSSSVTINSVSFIVGEVSQDGINAAVNIYEESACPPTLGTATLLHTEPVVINLADDGLTVTVAIPDIVVNNFAVVEVVQVDNGSMDPGGFFFSPAENTLGECGPTYIFAAGCGLTDWFPYAAIGFPDQGLVLDVGIVCCGDGVVEGDEECEPEVELLANGAFDANGGSFDGWFTFGNAFISAPDEVALSLPASGKMFGNFSGGFDVTGIGQAFPAAGGDSFVLEGWSQVRSADPLIGAGAPDDNWVVAKIAYFDAPAGGNEIGGNEVTIADGTSPQDVWMFNSVSGTAPMGTQRVEALFLFLQPNNDGGAVFVDDASFRLVNGCCTDMCTFESAGTVCAAGDDAACLGDAVCDGASGGCPANGPADAGTECRPAAGPCDVPETCDGQNAGCPDDAVADAGTVCSPGSPSACLADAECDGTNVTCPPNEPIVMCVDGDGCCPSTCNANSDSDCDAVCGNGRLEAGECCDDGNLEDGDGCSAECECEAPPVPTVTEWGMIALMLALLAGIAVVFGRRRQVA